MNWPQGVDINTGKSNLKQPDADMKHRILLASGQDIDSVMLDLSVLAFKVILARIKLFKSLVPHGFCLVFLVCLELLLISAHFTLFP